MGFVRKSFPQLQTVSFYRFLLKILAVTAYVVILSLIFGVVSDDYNSVEERRTARSDTADSIEDGSLLEFADIASNYAKDEKFESGNSSSMISSAKLKETIVRLNDAKSISEIKEISYNFAEDINE